MDEDDRVLFELVMKCLRHNFYGEMTSMELKNLIAKMPFDVRNMVWDMLMRNEGHEHLNGAFHEH